MTFHNHRIIFHIYKWLSGYSENKKYLFVFFFIDMLTHHDVLTQVYGSETFHLQHRALMLHFVVNSVVDFTETFRFSAIIVVGRTPLANSACV